MTETTSAPAPTEPSKPAVQLDEFGQQAKERLVSTIADYNALVTEYKASQGSEQELLEALRDTHTDNGGEFDKLQDTITKLDKALDEAIRKRDELLKPVVAERMATRSNDGVDAITEKMTALHKVIKNGTDYLKGLYGEGAVEDLPAVNRRTGGSTSAGTSGNKRVRGFDFYVDGVRAEQKDGQNVLRSNLSAAAKKIEVDPKVMQEAFWEAQGTQDTKQFKDTVTFTVKNGDTAYEILAKKQEEE